MGVEKSETEESLHSICAWTFNSGKGGFVPADQRPKWANLTTVDKVHIIRDEIKPRLPDNIVLGMEMHYDNEVNESTAGEIADALADSGIYLAMVTPGAHIHFAYGGMASLDDKERKAAEEFGIKTVDIAYGALRKAWHQDAKKAPSFVLWNGSWGYDIATPLIAEMLNRLESSVARLGRYEQQKGGALYLAIEPKPNEGHPAMLIPTVADALLFARDMKSGYGLEKEMKGGGYGLKIGVNKEFGHSEMIGLDTVYETVRELKEVTMFHMHLNSQGYNDGITLGGPGKFDIDHGVKINGANISIARLLQDYGYSRWKGHDMQPRPYDNEEQAIDRVVTSILKWEACAKAAKGLDTTALLCCLSHRDTAKAEEIMGDAVMSAQNYFRHNTTLKTNKFTQPYWL